MLFMHWTLYVICVNVYIHLGMHLVEVSDKVRIIWIKWENKDQEKKCFLDYKNIFISCLFLGFKEICNCALWIDVYPWFLWLSLIFISVLWDSDLYCKFGNKTFCFYKLCTILTPDKPLCYKILVLLFLHVGLQLEW